MSGKVDQTGNVVLVHGIFDTGAVFRKMSESLIAEGFRTFTPDLTPNSGSRGLDHLACQLRDYVDLHLPRQEKFFLVGFSMGGLVCRYYLQKLEGIRRVAKFISISSPHNGSRLACALPHTGGRQMRPNSDFINDLNRNAGSLDSLTPVSIWTPFDLSIVPAESSKMEEFRDVRIPVLLHPWMLTDPKSIEVVIRELKAELG
ncbi:MAG: alpha/beta fold hydrolase [Chlorobiaceae bacterium]|nr:alpha/beta fold hydrolase [Chlorobiaceae bacterium]